METLRADLHLHSALSPCAEPEMSPEGLVRAALLADLAVIAVTDHNAADNTAAVQAATERAGIWAIPGMEVQTREEVHLLCYFSDLEALDSFAGLVWEHLPEIPNDERLFG
ncbi:MAG: PHP domain-containing protein, partial [Firmicutes bacterium]|nr:PHP domain-containing protein [Bacillota bacterium]